MAIGQNRIQAIVLAASPMAQHVGVVHPVLRSKLCLSVCVGLCVAQCQCGCSHQVLRCSVDKAIMGQRASWSAALYVATSQLQPVRVCSLPAVLLPSCLTTSYAVLVPLAVRSYTIVCVFCGVGEYTPVSMMTQAGLCVHRAATLSAVSAGSQSGWPYLRL